MISDAEWLAEERRLRSLGFHVNADGQVVCPHRGKSCCPKCLAEQDSIVDVYGVEMFEPDPEARAAL